MFIVWGNKWKYEPKQDGLQVTKRCLECECCEKKMRLPILDKKIKVTCPDCGYFYYIRRSRIID